MVMGSDGGQGRIRTFVPRKEGQIYSLLALTTHPPVRSDFQSITRILSPPPRLTSLMEQRPRCDVGRRAFSFYLPAGWHTWRPEAPRGRTKISPTGPKKTPR